MPFASLTRLLLGFVLAVGGSIVWMTLFGIGSSLCQTFAPGLSFGDQFGDQYGVVVTSQGDALVRHVSYVLKKGHAIPQVEYRTLEDKPVDVPSGDNAHSKNRLVYAPAEFGESADTIGLLPANWQSQPIPWRLRVTPFVEGDQRERDRSTWYFIQPNQRDGSGYFVGFDNTLKRQLGYLGTDGLADKVPDRAQQFPAWSVDGKRLIQFIPDGPDGGPLAMHGLPLSEADPHTYNGIVAIAPERDVVFVIDFAKKSVRQFPVQGLRSFLHSRDNWGSLDAYERDLEVEHDPSAVRHYLDHITLRFADRIETRTPNFDLVETILLPAVLRDEPKKPLTIHATSDAYVAVVEGGVKTDGDQKRSTTQVVWFDKQGHVTRQAETSRPLSNVKLRFDLSVASSLEPIGILSSYRWLLHSPYGLFDVETQKYIRNPDDPITWDIRVQVAQRMWRLQGNQIIACIVAGMIGAVLCMRRQRRLGMSSFDTIAWPLFVFCFGPIGWVAYYSHRDWPTVSRAS